MVNLKSAVENSDSISIGDCLVNGWKIVSHNLGFYILGGLVTIIFFYIASLIPEFGSMIVNLFLNPMLYAGAIFVTWRIAIGDGWNNFSDMFYGFKIFSTIFISTLLYSIFFFLIILFFIFIFFIFNFQELSQIFEMDGFGNFSKNQDVSTDLEDSLLSLKNGFLFLLLIFAFIFSSLIWMFRTHFIVVYNAGPWEAMEASRKIVMKNFFPLLSLVVILVLIVIVSILPLLLGLLFSLPLSITAIYCAFAQITNCEYVEEEIRKDSDSNLFPTY